MITFKKITWDQILHVWKEHLPNMALEKNSAMCLFLNNGKILEKRWDEPMYDLQNMEFPATFWGAFDDDKLIGVNSGHMTLNKFYRSRGLYVQEEYRKKHIGRKLLMKTMAQAKHEKAIACWSYPKNSAIKCYQSLGFHSSGQDFNFHYEGDNIRALVIIDRAELKNYFHPKPVVIELP